MKGIKRFRQAIKNQLDTGEGEFRLTYHDAEEIADEIEDELAQLAWAKDVPTPVDADGNVVPLTTKVMYGDDGRELEIIFFKFNTDNRATRWLAFCKNKDGDRGYAAVSSVHLRRPDSWERLEEDAAKGICDYFDHSSCLKCPGFNHASHSCDKARAQDIVRRAKALAERDVKEASCG